MMCREDIPGLNRLYFGGAGSLRGYREDFFKSDILIKASADLFYVTGKNDLAFRLFYDACYYNPSRQNISKIDDLNFLSAAGAGIIFEGRSGYIGLTAGVPLDRSVGESVLHVKYSVRF